MKPVCNGVCPVLIVKDSGLEIGSWFVSLRQISKVDFSSVCTHFVHIIIIILLCLWSVMWTSGV